MKQRGEIHSWVTEAQGAAGSPIDVELIKRRAWQFFHREIEGNFFFKLFGIAGKIRGLFEKIFGTDALR